MVKPFEKKLTMAMQMEQIYEKVDFETADAYLFTFREIAISMMVKTKMTMKKPSIHCGPYVRDVQPEESRANLY